MPAATGTARRAARLPRAEAPRAEAPRAQVAPGRCARLMPRATRCGVCHNAVLHGGAEEALHCEGAWKAGRGGRRPLVGRLWRNRSARRLYTVTGRARAGPGRQRAPAKPLNVKVGDEVTGKARRRNMLGLGLGRACAAALIVARTRRWHSLHGNASQMAAARKPAGNGELRCAWASMRECTLRRLCAAVLLVLAVAFARQCLGSLCSWCLA